MLLFENPLVRAEQGVILRTKQGDWAGSTSNVAKLDQSAPRSYSFRSSWNKLRRSLVCIDCVARESLEIVSHGIVVDRYVQWTETCGECRKVCLVVTVPTCTC